MPSDAPVLYEERDGVAWLTLNRPGAMNALNRELLASLSLCADEIRGNDVIRAVVITGAGDRAFSAGADISFLNAASPKEIQELALFAVTVFRKLETCGKAVIAAINGYALGGGLELAESCHVRIASDRAMLGHPEVRIGAVAGWGGTSRLPRLVGRGRATEMLLTGRMINAREALDMGLVNRVTPAGGLLEEARTLAEEISKLSPSAVRLALEAIDRGLEMPLDESLRTGADYFGLAAETEDFREGTKAFLEKRPPRFSGRRYRGLLHKNEADMLKKSIKRGKEKNRQGACKLVY